MPEIEIALILFGMLCAKIWRRVEQQRSHGGVDCSWSVKDLFAKDSAAFEVWLV